MAILAKIEKETICKMTGSELRRLRVAAGLEQKELAAFMADFKWNRHTVANYERLKDGSFTLHLQEAEELLHFLNAKSL